MLRSAIARVVVVAGLLLASCGDLHSEEIVKESCLEPRCGWQVEQGAVQRSPSWHPTDYSYALVGVPARLAYTPVVSHNYRCVHVSYLGDIDDSAQGTIEADFDNDGIGDVERDVVGSNFWPVQFTFRTPADYKSLSLRLKKAGEGTMKLAQFRVVGDDFCDEPPTFLKDGAPCVVDATCSSGRCVLGQCSTCPAGGCAEGEACKNSDQCMDGACAGGVCRACAKDGSCAANERCSVAGQCGSKICTTGAVPSMASFPGLDGTCGDCANDAECGAGGHCVHGRCSECATDDDCTDGRSCRYADGVDALVRKCLPPPTSPLPRGALCESNGDCVGGLKCGAAGDRAKRCGFACGSDQDCGSIALCIAPGARALTSNASTFSLTPRWKDVSGRVSTCYPLAFERGACELHQQCDRSSSFGVFVTGTAACCSGRCLENSLNLATNECTTPENVFW